VSQRLKIHGIDRAGVLIEKSSRNVDNALPRMHQVIGYRSNPLCVARTAGTRRIAQVARKCEQTKMSIFLLYGPVIAGVTRNAIGRCEGMCVAEPGLPGCMALQTSAFGRRTDLFTEDRIHREEEYAAPTDSETHSKPHGVVIARLHARDP
jgi:hypothetical protein